MKMIKFLILIAGGEMIFYVFIGSAKPTGIDIAPDIYWLRENCLSVGLIQIEKAHTAGQTEKIKTLEGKKCV
ncbi:hypothetical protein B1H58_12075 [Pantoea alhagi]|uniref:Uncharacterized protein n=1 Tax=Pantoea alhagi TaxID=1891675 RepID=A0A1W6B6G5_9GAMM|nr:hypothetical protein B1H58_12075 [Pantoea alhagi]